GSRRKVRSWFRGYLAVGTRRDAWPPAGACSGAAAVATAPLQDPQDGELSGSQAPAVVMVLPVSSSVLRLASSHGQPPPPFSTSPLPATSLAVPGDSGSSCVRVTRVRPEGP